jgi:hypothetical protein
MCKKYEIFFRKILTMEWRLLRRFAPRNDGVSKLNSGWELTEASKSHGHCEPDGAYAETLAKA